MRPATEEEQRLHERLVRREISATADLSEIYLQPLIQVLRRKFPALSDREDVDSAVIDALLDLGERPEMYRPEIGSLWGFLYMVAWRDLCNLVKQERRRSGVGETEDGPGEEQPSQRITRITIAEDDVELLPDSRNRSIEEMVIARLCPEGLPEGVDIEAAQGAVREAFPTAEDEAVLELILDGVRDSEPYAVAMRIEGLPAGEQTAVVKRRKDAAKLRLKRIGKRLKSAPG